jgi:peptide/nickel transport system permease protein
MTRYVIRRLVEAIPVVLIITFLAFVLVQLAPGDPVSLLVDVNSLTPAQLENVRAHLGLNEPLPVQYTKMIGSLLVGDLRSIRTGQPTTAMVLEALPTTLVLMFWALLTGMLAGLAFGVVSALRPYSALDNVVTVVALAGISVPHFWLALTLVLVFSETLGWLPASGVRPLGASGGNPLEGIPYWILPTVVMGSGVAAVFTRYARSAMLETLHQDYVRTARSKGLSEPRVVVGHALRNSLITVVTLVGVYVPILLSGAVIVETVFALPGIGRLAVTGAMLRDYPVVLTTTLVAVVAVLLSNLVTDIAYTVVDPRVSLVEQR